MGRINNSAVKAPTGRWGKFKNFFHKVIEKVGPIAKKAGEWLQNKVSGKPAAPAEVPLYKSTTPQPPRTTYAEQFKDVW
jgi:hypothetical protein